MIDIEYTFYSWEKMANELSKGKALFWADRMSFVVKQLEYSVLSEAGEMMILLSKCANEFDKVKIENGDI